MALCAWLGAVLITSAVVAPAAFDVLPTRTLAGELVGRVLPVLFVSGALLGAAVSITQFGKSSGGIVAGLIMSIACVVAQFVISPKISAIRRSVGGPIDSLQAADPQRLMFGRLHGLSVLALGIAGVAALVVIVMVVRRLSLLRAA